MPHRHELRSLSGHDLAAACAKAEKYRDLNQPDESDSICRDILAVEPKNQQALRTLGLSLTDRFRENWMQHKVEALAVFERLDSEYERTYLSGVAWERYAKTLLHEEMWRGAFDAFHRALDLFDKAERIAPSDEPDPILRWNRIVRELTTHPQLIAAEAAPDASDLDFGDGPPG